MSPVFGLILFLIGIVSIEADFQTAFKLQLTLINDTYSYIFVEKQLPTDDVRPPLVFVLNDTDTNDNFLNDSFSENQTSVQFYHCEKNSATRIVDRQNPFDVLFIRIHLTNGTQYEISVDTPSIDSYEGKSEQNNFTVKQDTFVIKDASVTIEWFHDRSIRSIDEDEQTTTIELDTIMSSIEANETETETYTSTTPRPVPKKSHHLHLEVIAIIDSLIVNDLRNQLQRTEQETIEILKLYYLNIFVGIEQTYRQSLIHETLDVHIRLSKLIFATEKNRLPWEYDKSILSISNAYRNAPNIVQKRPNVTLKLGFLHNAYHNAKWDSKYSIGHADHIMTFTRLDLIDGAGLAFVSGVCLPSYKYSVIQEDFNPHTTTITAAHELGHNLGLNHDETDNKCNDPRFRYIMSPKNMNTIDRKQLALFSSCSIEQILSFVNKTDTECWKNRIQSSSDDKKFEDLRELSSNKLGQIVNIHEQCHLQYGSQSFAYISNSDGQNKTLFEENLCKELRCFKNFADNFMFWIDGAFDGTVCGKDRICQRRQCVSSNTTSTEKTDSTDLSECPYGDFYIPIPMMNLEDMKAQGNMRCRDALNLLRSKGMDVNYLCYNTTSSYERLCCEECKKHRINQCGDRHSHCPAFAQYCSNQYIRVNGIPLKELCPHTCGVCPSSSLMASTNKTSPIKKKTTKIRKYSKPTVFDKYTCIDSVDCSKLVKTYAKKKKTVKNWCSEHTIMIDGKYFPERCPKYCGLCNVTSECDEFQLCRNNGKCIKDDHGTYQCLCAKSYYGTLCEYRHTCSDKPCSSKSDFCIQTQGENHVCLSQNDKEKLRIILNEKKSKG